MLIRVILMIACCFLAACAAQHQPFGGQPQRSQLEIRQIQTRSYEGKQSADVMKAMLDVLQDEGFVVRNAVPELGLLSATKEIDVSDPGTAFFRTLFLGEEARWDKNSIIETTANVSPSGAGSRVRVTFQAKTLNNRGEVVGVREISDARFYQEFFAKVDKGLFVHAQGL